MQGIIASICQKFNEIIDFYILGFKKYAHFGGVATRKEVNLFVMATLSIGFLLAQWQSESVVVALLQIIFWVVSFPPFIAVIVRRLHDTNRSARFPIYMISLIVALLILARVLYAEVAFAGYVVLCLDLCLVFHLFFVIFLAKSNSKSCYKNTKSHPFRDGSILLVIALFPIVAIGYIIYSYQTTMSYEPEVLSQEVLSATEIDLIEKKTQEDFERTLGK